MPRGYLVLVLHAHLPYVRHPEHAHFFEEQWLFEAITESYIPLIRVLEGLSRDRIACRITLSLSPTLLAMLQDRLLQQRYLRHMERLIGLSDAEMQRARPEPGVHRLARMYREFFEDTVAVFKDRYKKNLITAFNKFYKAGLLDIITTSATHAFLPLLKVCPPAVRAQVLTGADYFKKVFGRPPAGMWLPECGYYPGLESVLQQAGYRYFFLENHGVLNADPQPRSGSFAPIACPNGVAAFCRDTGSSHQVWSSREGYPGDADYREFYRDIGFDRELEYLAPYLPEPATRMQTGIKYWRVTGHEDKELYDPDAARDKADQHARHFIACRIEEICRQAPRMDAPPAVVAPFDAELFGHWWFEGPRFLDSLIRGISAQQDMLEMITPADYLQRHPALQTAAPSGSSWGCLGYNDVWLNDTNDWLYPHLHNACRRMEELALLNPRKGSRPDRALSQAARELLLGQASDWPFIMRTGTDVSYARSRIRDHLARFYYLEKCIAAKKIDERRLRALEILDGIFPALDVRHFRLEQTTGTPRPDRCVKP